MLGADVGPVLLVVPRLTLGGTEKQIALLAGGLVRRGVDVQVIVLFSGGAREDDLRFEGVPFTVVGFPERPGELWRAPAAVLRLVSLMRRLRPTVVHAFLFEAHVLLPPVARLLGVPLVVAGRRAMSDYKGDRVWAWRLERLANRFVHLFIANAAVVADSVVSTESVPRDRVLVIPNAAAPGSFDVPVPLQLGRPPVVVCVANLFAYKGHAVLLRAVSSLVQQGVQCRVVLVGDGPERAALQQCARERGLDVEFVGQRADAARYIAASDVVVLPSLHEGMSNALMEAMALARPIVATWVGGTPELLGDTGLMCPPGDPEALAEALRRLLIDPALRATLGEAARDRLSREFSVDELVDRHLVAYAVTTRAPRGALG